MNTTIGPIALVGVVLAALVAIALVAVTASQTASPQADVTARGQSHDEALTSPWADDYHGGRV